MNKKLLLIAFLVSVFTARAATNLVITKISEYPRTNMLPASALFVTAWTNVVPHTNYGIRYDDLATQILREVSVGPWSASTNTIYPTDLANEHVYIPTDLTLGIIPNSIPAGGVSSVFISTNLISIQQYDDNGMQDLGTLNTTSFTSDVANWSQGALRSSVEYADFLLINVIGSATTAQISMQAGGNAPGGSTGSGTNAAFQMRANLTGTGLKTFVQILPTSTNVSEAPFFFDTLNSRTGDTLFSISNGGDERLRLLDEGSLVVSDSAAVVAGSEFSFVLGSGQTVDGDANIVSAFAATVTGDQNSVFGNGHTTTGDNNLVGGSANTVTGNRNFVFGSGLTVTADDQFVVDNAASFARSLSVSNNFNSPTNASSPGDVYTATDTAGHSKWAAPTITPATTNATDLTTGTLADDRLSSNVPLLNGTNAFTGTNTFSAPIYSTHAGSSNAVSIGSSTSNGVYFPNGTVVIASKGTNVFSVTNGTVVFRGGGTAGRPLIAFAEDDDGTGCGILRNSANSIGLSVNGSVRFIFDSSYFYIGAGTEVRLWHDGANRFQLGASGTQTITVTPGFGSNLAGDSIRIEGGKSTGTGLAGTIHLAVSTNNLSSGSVNNSVSNVVSIGSDSIGLQLTNRAMFRILTNDYVLGTRYTNTIAGGYDNRRASVFATITLNAAAAGTAQVTLYAEQGSGITNKWTVSAGPLASLVTLEELSGRVNPGGVFYFTDETSGTGATASITGGTCSWFGE